MANLIGENIIKDLGFDRLPRGEQEKAILSFGRIIFQAVLIRVLDELDEKSKDEFEALLTKRPDDQDAILAFLQTKLPNLNDIVNEEVSRLKAESADLMKGVGGK
jgi:hypothetical protein